MYCQYLLYIQKHRSTKSARGFLDSGRL
ncbi:hypothetical protein OOU_Y34scaffold00697g9 [Pyricularia oryzae Y34]|uniref:Uncharacterized protein n=2 Tax=Pyricularia oryzae TaxID=318829 RepID=A0AA97NSR2_PYRO3|nr:hypothetical protein OOU_Y34scaffold00697g9 [Pyricularia oryzae Y34]